MGQTLKLKLGVHLADFEEIDLLEEDHKILRSRLYGAGFMEDGEPLSAEIAASCDYTHGDGQVLGYIILKFQDGSGLSCKFCGMAKDASIKAEVLEVSGVGRYFGVKGTGSWTGVRLGFENLDIRRSLVFDSFEINLE